MQAKVIYKNGQPFFQINGRDYPPVAFMSYAPTTERDANFRNNGMKFFSFTLFFGDKGIHPNIGLRPFSEGFWKGYGEYDFTACDKLMEMAAPGGKGAFIFPRIFIDAPGWWYEKNPKECCINSSGRRELQSFASEKWRLDVKVAIEALIDHIRTSTWKECVFGMHVAFGGTEECCYHNFQGQYGVMVDRSKHSLSRYRKWLKDKYGTIEALCSQWGHSSQEMGIKSFECIEFPQNIEIFGSLGGVIRDMRRERHVMDYLKFHSFLLADTLIYLCKCVKDYTDNSYITGGFFGYILHYGRVHRGHNDSYDVFTSPYVDFVSTAGGGFTMAAAQSSAILHEKLWFAEGDIRTDTSTLLSESMPEVLPLYNGRYEDRELWKGPETKELGISWLRRGAAHVLTQKSGIWYFDMWGGWFDSEEKMKEISATENLMLNQSKENTLRLNPRVALIVDEEGQFCYGGVTASEIYTMINGFPEEIRLVGTPHHTYLAEDLADDRFNPDDYDFYIMIGFVNPSERVRAGVERLKAGGRTLLWMHMAGIEDASLSDFTVHYDKQAPRITASYDMITKESAALFDEQKPARCGRFSIDDQITSYPLGYIVPEGEKTASSEPVLLYKKLKHYNSIYCLMPSMPAATLHELMALAGVFLYSSSGDCVFAGGNLVGMYSPNGGEKRIDLPSRVKSVYDAITGERWADNEKLNIPFIVKPGETRLFYVAMHRSETDGGMSYR